ncbi:LysR family transcriptional regulator [Paenibacillus sp. NPDC057934]|uniref:LysR family transcriptional regulator n=1 Tax=Paenibacillus sp. NPDC057934 TaxID=3346282 RepID=UPI0036DB13FC
MMTILQLQVFAAAAEAKSFTRAAEDLGFTQSAVSQMIQSLEKELGILLFHRSRQGIVLTENGEAMLKHARLILHTTQVMKEEAALAVQMQAGSLRIGATPDIACRFVPELSEAFKQSFPGSELVVFEGESEEINEWIASGVIDVGITMFPDPQWHSVPLIRDEMVVLLPENHPLGQESFLNFEQIKEQCFLMPKDEDLRNLLLSSHSGFNVVMEVKDFNTIQAMVQEGLGLSILPRFYISRLGAKLPAVSFAPALMQEVVMAVKDEINIPRLAAEFMRLALAYIRKHRQDAVTGG